MSTELPGTWTSAAAEAIRQVERDKNYGIMTADDIAAAVLAAVVPLIEAAARDKMLTELREFLGQYVGMVEQKYTWNDGDERIGYASGPIAFPDALIDTFVLMTTPDEYFKREQT